MNMERKKEERKEEQVVTPKSVTQEFIGKV